MMQQQLLIKVKHCPRCGKTKPVEDFYKQTNSKDGLQSMCKACKAVANLKSHAKGDPRSNPTRMWVNGKYISKTHPLHKPGRYKTFEDAAFSGLEKYESSTEGQVYVITNPNFPEWVKVGMAVDAEDRLNGYQTSSPFRDYSLAASWDVTDRRAAESESHAALQKLYERRSEWFNCTPEQAKEVVEEITENYK